jgi:hypothetical protein
MKEKKKGMKGRERREEKEEKKTGCVHMAMADCRLWFWL